MMFGGENDFEDADRVETSSAKRQIVALAIALTPLIVGVVFLAVIVVRG